jgi:DNA-binding SARP family transcriptional activator/predicted ATPase
LDGLHIQLLGTPVVEVDGAPLQVDTRKAVALLAYLAVTARAHSRDVLAELLWPSSDPESGRAALRRTLSVLRKGLGDRWLAVRRDSVALEPSGMELDVARFRERLHREEVEEAVSLARGEFMEGFGLRDSAAFDDWQLAEAQTFRRELGSALERLAREQADRGELAAAIGHARRGLSLDPLSEAAHRLLIRLYAQSGERAAALEQYRECVRTLHRELGVAPVEETTALYEAVSEGRLPVPATVRTLEVEPRAGIRRLVGREAELGELLAAWESAGSGGRLLVIEGEAGIGKTRLVEELAARVASSGGETLGMRGREGESELAYGLIAEALRHILARDPSAGRLATVAPHALAEAARLVPELEGLVAGLPGPQPIEGPGAHERFVAALADVLSAACAGRPPGLLVVDDAQWADAPSLEVLAFLARRLEERSMCVLFAWRSEDVGGGHVLRRLVEDARRSAIATVVPRRLDLEAVEELAQDAGLPGEADRILADTAGLALFVVEYLAALERGEEASPPASVVELLRARAGAVSEIAGQVLAAAAVLESFDADAVRDTSGRGDEEAVAALEELQRRNLLVESGDVYTFSHEKLREVVYGDTSLARRRLLHRRAAATLGLQFRRTPGKRAGVVAEHYRLGGQEAEAAEYHRLAGEHARSLFANAQAVTHFESALALGHPDEAALHEAIGDLLTLIGDYGAALRSLEAAAALVSDPPALARIEHKLGGVYQRRGEWEVAAGRLEDAARAAEGDPALAARIEADRSLNEHRRGRGTEALTLARRALKLAEDAGDRASSAQAHNLLGMLASSSGDFLEARRQLQLSLGLAKQLPEPGASVAALNNLALVARAECDFEKAIELTREALELCTMQGDRHREAALHNNLADLLHETDRPDEAMAHLKQAVAIFADIGAGTGDTQPEIWKLVEW